MRKLFCCVWLSFILVVLVVGFVCVEFKKLFFFGNSLIYYLIDMDIMIVFYWFVYFVE